LMLTACASSGVRSVDPPPASLSQPCPDLQAPSDGTGGTLLRWSIRTVEAYRVCQSRHQRLVEAWPKP